MRRFLLRWFVLASSFAVASVVLNFFLLSSVGLTTELLVTVCAVTLAQTAVLQFIPRFSRPHESPDQHR